MPQVAQWLEVLGKEGTNSVGAVKLKQVQVITRHGDRTNAHKCWRKELSAFDCSLLSGSSIGLREPHGKKTDWEDSLWSNRIFRKVHIAGRTIIRM